MPPSGLWCGSESRPAFIDVFHVRGLASPGADLPPPRGQPGQSVPVWSPAGVRPRWPLGGVPRPGCRPGVFHRLVIPPRLRLETVGGCVASVGNKVGTWLSSMSRRTVAALSRLMSPCLAKKAWACSMVRRCRSTCCNRLLVPRRCGRLGCGQYPPLRYRARDATCRGSRRPAAPHRVDTRLLAHTDPDRPTRPHSVATSAAPRRGREA